KRYQKMPRRAKATWKVAKATEEGSLYVQPHTTVLKKGVLGAQPLIKRVVGGVRKKEVFGYTIPLKASLSFLI
ncbi:MAG: hypothetical protein JXN65_06750, partial [Clostridia bacterium]|nr:hypothetical protein [Clostridia bacterium]